MHPNPVFHTKQAKENLAFARDRGFGVLAVDGPLLAHIPFVVTEDSQKVELHLMRSNPIARVKPDPQAVIAVSGPDAYVSPDWYDTLDQVPTWNYVAVHLRGRLERLPDQALRPLLDRLSLEFESRMAPKQPWQSNKMTPDALERMLRMIVPFQLHIEDIQGTWKLGQNKPKQARNGAAAGIDSFGIGSNVHNIAALMRDNSGE